jgi:hypothetical protein
MENPCIKKGLGVIVLILFLSTTCLPIVNASEGKPDLIIEEIGFAPDGDSGREDVACMTIKNIGNATSQEEISYKYTFTQMLFGIIPIRIIRTDTLSMYCEGGLKPQDFCSPRLIYEYELPKFGIFSFSCRVNPDLTNEESNYNNNFLSHKYVAFLGQWLEIG